jgi:hypothetical protein
MEFPLAENSQGNPAPCRVARRLLIIAVTASMLMVLAITADMLLRVPNQDASAKAWINALALFEPALWPAGSPMRHSETLHPGVDLRFSPGLEILP